MIKIVLRSILFFLLISTALSAEMEHRSYEFDIKKKSMEKALLEFANQTGLSIIFRQEIIQKQLYIELTGHYDLVTALELLLKNSELEYEFIDKKTLVITHKDKKSKQVSDNKIERIDQTERINVVTASDSDAEVDYSQPTLEEVVVIARHREENLQITPVAATVLSSSTMDFHNMSDLSDIDNAAPNIMFINGKGAGASTTSAVYIRGVGQDDFLISTDPGVGIYIDGVYQARSLGTVTELLDLERVEILRGPQGTLFGKNTIGGAINLISKQPEETFHAQSKVTIGSRERLDFQGIVNIPLSADLRTKLSVLKRDQNGYGEEILTGRKTGDTDRFVGRGQLLWLPNDRLSLNISVDGMHVRERSLPTSYISVNISGIDARLYNSVIAPRLGTELYDSRWDTTDSYENFSTEQAFNKLDSLGLSGTFSLQLEDNLLLKSITAYRKLHNHFGRDDDYTPLDIYYLEFNTRQHQISQEFQLLGSNFDEHLRWILGFYYFKESAKSRDEIVVNPDLFDSLELLTSTVPGLSIGGAGNPANIDFDFDFDLFNKSDVQSIAVFLHGNIALTERLSMSGGVRYTWEAKDYFFRAFRNNSGVFAVAPINLDDSWDNFSGKIGMEYQWTAEMMTYFSVSQGFKSGGFNGRPTRIEELTSFNPEKVLAYELGLKSTFWNRRIRLNMAAFFNDYTDIQLGAFQITPQGTTIAIVENGADVEMKGFEIELEARPTTGLELGYNIGYLDDDVIKVDSRALTLTRSTDLPLTPKWVMNGSFKYTHLIELGTVTLAANWVYRAAHFVQLTSEKTTRQAGHSLFGAHLSFRPSNERWEVSVYGTNLSDERYLVDTSPTGITGTYAKPREWGLSVKLNFE